MDNLMLRDELVESHIILKYKGNSRFLLKSGISVALSDNLEPSDFCCAFIALQAFLQA